MNVSTIYLNSIEIEWKPGGISDVIYYMIKYKKIDLDAENLESEEYDIDNDHQYSTINTTNTKIRIGNFLKPYTLYEFRIIAVNQLGKSPPTSPLVVRTAAASMYYFSNIF